MIRCDVTPRPVPTHSADTLKTCFREVFRCRASDFGSPFRGVLCISDGNEGVQRNAGNGPGDGFDWLGVNFEGLKYDDWPVAGLIEREDLPPAGRKTRQGHRASGTRRVALLRPALDQGGEYGPHADQAGAVRWLK